MVREAEQHSAEDRRRREVIEARNEADALVYTTEKNLKEYGDRLSDTDRRRIEQAVADLRSAMAGDDAAAIRQRAAALEQAAACSRQQGSNRVMRVRGREAKRAGGGDEQVVDAEFEEATDDRRRAP